MSFRLFNLPADFQGYINKILAEKLNIFVIIYFNNIFIYNEDLAKAISKLYDEYSSNYVSILYIQLEKILLLLGESEISQLSSIFVGYLY